MQLLPKAVPAVDASTCRNCLRAGEFSRPPAPLESRVKPPETRRKRLCNTDLKLRSGCIASVPASTMQCRRGSAKGAGRTRTDGFLRALPSASSAFFLKSFAGAGNIFPMSAREAARLRMRLASRRRTPLAADEVRPQGDTHEIHEETHPRRRFPRHAAHRDQRPRRAARGRRRRAAGAGADRRDVAPGGVGGGAVRRRAERGPEDRRRRRHRAAALRRIGGALRRHRDGRHQRHPHRPQRGLRVHALGRQLGADPEAARRRRRGGRQRALRRLDRGQRHDRGRRRGRRHGRRQSEPGRGLRLPQERRELEARSPRSSRPTAPRTTTSATRSRSPATGCWSAHTTRT